MGQNLCCLRPPNSAQKRTQNPSSGANNNEAANPTPNQHKPFVQVERITTLGEIIINSPTLDSHRYQNVQRTENDRMLMQTGKRVLYHTSPDFNNVFHTPRISFSSGKLEKIDELSGDGEEGKGRQKVKKVTFKLPDDSPADIHVVTLYSTIRSGVIC